MKQAEPYLRHIMDEVEYLLGNSAALEYQDFIQNETLKRSFVRSLEVIGEAAKNIPVTFRNKHPQISWKEMTGLRNILIHHYFGIDYKTVWDVVKNKIPELKKHLANFFKNKSSA